MRAYNRSTPIALKLLAGFLLLVTSIFSVNSAVAESSHLSEIFVPKLDVFDCATVEEIPLEECQALVALYTSAGGDSWTNRTDWLQTNTPCQWYGVGCGTGNVVTLQLAGNQLSGSIPPELGSLTNLSDLYLGDNQLSGSIPPELGNLSNLEFLDLWSNQLEGLIPPGLGDLSNLTHLELGSNQLSGSIPPELGNLSNLEFLDLWSNQLSGEIPPELGNLTKLRSLGLSYNPLTGNIPIEFGDLTNLYGLNLGQTQLSGEIPTTFTKLTRLIYLTLSCGLTSTDPNVISFIANRLGPNWDVACVANDHFTDAVTLDFFPFTDALDTSQATSDADDPSLPCWPYTQGINSVWYRFAPTENGTLTVDTFGSSYDTMLAIWTGTPGAMTNYGCANNSNGTYQSLLNVAVSADEEYFIEVVANDYPGVLNFTADFLPVATPQISASISPNPVGMDSGQGRYVFISFTEVAGGSGNLYMDPVAQFFTQYGQPLSEPTPLLQRTYSTYFYPYQATYPRWYWLSLPSRVVEDARALGEYAIVWQTTFSGVADTGESFSTQASQLIILSPDNFSKLGPTDESDEQPTDLTLSWNSSIGATHYEYCLDTVHNYPCDSAEGWLGTYDTSVTLNNLAPGTTYYWQVRAVNTSGETAADSSDWWTFTTQPNVPPVVQSISRAGINPTNAASVDFSVTFSKPVSGVDETDFALTSTVAGASISSVAATADPAVYTVTVNTGSGNGTLRLDLVDDDSIVDSVLDPLGGTGSGNGNFTGGESYTIIKYPSVVSVERFNYDPTTLANVFYVVTFSEAVTGVNAADFMLTSTGTLAGASVLSVTGTGATRTVKVSTGTGSGTLRLDLVDDDSIKDLSGNSLGGTGTGNGNFTGGQFYNVRPPMVVSILRLNTATTRLGTVFYSVTFSENVTGVNGADFNVTTDGTLSGAYVMSVTGSGATRTVKVNTGTGDGTLRLNLMDDDSIQGTVMPLGGVGTGNGDYPYGQIYTVDKTGPIVVSIERMNYDPSSLSAVYYLVTFSEPVLGVNKGDFVLTTTGAVTGAVVNRLSGSGATRTVKVLTGTGDGTIRLDILDDDGILDYAYNPLGGIGVGNGAFDTGQAYTIFKP